MFFNDAISKLQASLRTDLLSFAPELLLIAGIVAMLLLRLLPRLRMHMGGVALLFTGCALLLSVAQWWDVAVSDKGTWSLATLNLMGRFNDRSIFAGLIAVDYLTAFMRMLLLGFAMLLIWLSMVTGIPDEEDSADFCTLLLGGILGMLLMAEANHLLMVFIAIEMASLPSYALAGFLKGRRQSSEAALKYVVYGGGASGVMLYGISLISGRFGTGYLPDVALALQEQMKTGSGTLAGMDTVVLLGLVFILAGLGFKLSAVPFHFWAPDVFEGAAAEVGAFLSVASKAAALALTARLLLMLSHVGAYHESLEPVRRTLGPAIAFFAALTATFGNLAAYPQTNLKRLLAYSTIAHAGYMLMGLAPLNSAGLGAVLFYLVAYLLMNLGAFAMVAFLRNAAGSEDLRDMRGLVYRSPLAVALLGVFLLSLLGLPPLAGFAAKFQVFSVLFDSGKEYTAQAQAAGSQPTLGYTMYALLVIGGINTVISAVYYLKVMKVMILERPVEELEGRPAAALRLPIGAAVFASLLGLLVFAAGVAWNPIAVASDRGASDFRGLPRVTLGPQQGPAGGGGPPGGGRPGGGPAGGGRPRGPARRSTQADIRGVRP